MLPFISAMRIRDVPAKESKSGSDDDNTHGGNEKLESQQSSSDSEGDSSTEEESEQEKSSDSDEDQSDEESDTEKENYLNQKEERVEEGGEEIKEKEVGDANVNAEQLKLASKGDDDQNNGTEANKEECGGE